MKKKVLILLCVFSCCNLVGCNVDSELLFGSERITFAKLENDIILFQLISVMSMIGFGMVAEKRTV